MNHYIVAEQPRTHEEQKSFDTLASVRMMRYDLEHFGEVLPETREQVGNEELSFLAEGVNRAARTPFALKRHGEDLTYFKDGHWRPYTAMLLTGLKVAEAEAKEDPRKQFLVDWATRDLQKGYDMRSLQPGEQAIWHNSYPHELEALYGRDFLASCGLQIDRKMGFVYRAYCNEAGDVILESQTLDQSDPDALLAIDEALNYDPEMNLDAAVKVYDGALFQKTGERTHAGRDFREAHKNVWETILGQEDLITYLLDGIEDIARLEFDEEYLDEPAKEHIYGVWAAFKKRISGETTKSILDEAGVSVSPQVAVALEVKAAFDDFAARGKVLVGCGGTVQVIRGKDGIMAAMPEEVFNAIFGEGEGSESGENYSFDSWMYCTDCQKPPEDGESKKWCGPCGFCRDCDKKHGGKG